jgi:hypothetical protein
MPPPATLLGVDLRRPPGQSGVPIQVYPFHAPAARPMLATRVPHYSLRKLLILKGRLLHLTLPILPISAPMGR